MSALVLLCSLVIPQPQPASQQSQPQPRDEWRVIYRDGIRVGYERTRYEIEREGTVRVTRERRVDPKQAGRGLYLESEATIRMTEDGVLRSFSSREAGRAGRTVSLNATLEKTQLKLQTKRPGRTVNSEFIVAADLRTMDWFAFQLVGEPMPPRTRMKFVATAGGENPEPFMFRVQSATWRHLRLPDNTRLELLPLTIERSDQPGQREKWYMDRNGRIAMSELRHAGATLLMQMVPRQKAQTIRETREVDMRLARLVPSKGRLEQGSDARDAVYLVSGTVGLDRTLNHGPRQQVSAGSDGSVRVAVHSPELVPGKRHRRVDRKYLNPTRLLDSRDSNIQRLALEAAGAEFNPTVVAIRLQKFVGKYLRNRTFSTATATASEIVKAKQGDCTEHAVLLAAMLRAKRIPSRVAYGFLYIDNRAGFSTHMWTEAMLDGEWTALDAMAGKKTPGAGYLKISHSALGDSESVMDGFLPLADLMERIQIEVESKP